MEQRERRHLASLLHDDLQQTLAAARLHLASGDANTALGLLDEGLRSTRSLSHAMAPPQLGADLFTALEGLERLFRARYRLAVRLDLPPAAPALPDLVRDVGFSAVRELLFNVVKHAATESAEVAVRLDGDTLRVEVADLGRGFDVDHAAFGLGLDGVRGRVAAIGGTVAIASAPGDGTRVRLDFPGALSPR